VNHDILANKGTSYSLDARQRKENIFQNTSRSHPASCMVCNGEYSFGV